MSDSLQRPPRSLASSLLVELTAGSLCLLVLRRLGDIRKFALTHWYKEQSTHHSNL